MRDPNEPLIDLLRRKQGEMKSMTARMALQVEIDWRMRMAHTVARSHAAGLLMADGWRP